MNLQLLTLKKEIMLRVRFIYLFKKALRPFVLESVALIAVVFLAARFVFVAKILENAPSVGELPEFLAFFIRAFLNTEFAVQTFVLGAVVASLLALRDFVRSLTIWSQFRFHRI